MWVVCIVRGEGELSLGAVYGVEVDEGRYDISRWRVRV